MAVAAAHRRVLSALRTHALAYPETREDHPWGEIAIKVKGKVFVFIGVGDEGLGLSTKLPISGAIALSLPFAEPTGYGLGKSGWVSAHFGPKDAPPLELLKAWVDESFRAVAPKKVLAQLEGRPPKAKKKVAKKAR